MKLILIAALLLVQPDSLSLDWCLRHAQTAFPGVAERAAREAITDLAIDNLGVRYLPGIKLTGQAAYQSDVADIPLNVPGIDFPSISHDQYKAALGIEQLVFDGGATSAEKRLERLELQLSRSQIDIDAHALQGSVMDTYFAALIADERRASLQTLRSDIEARLSTVEAGIRQGILTEETAEILSVELLKIDQRMSEIRASRQTAIHTLSELVQMPLAEDVPLTVPAAAASDGDLAVRRPEQKVFDASRALLEARTELAAMPFRPRIAGFAEAAYGRPVGMNFFRDEFDFFFSAGLSLNWKLWDWKQVRRKRQAARREEEIIQTQEERFMRRIRIEAGAVKREIERLALQLERDREIINRRRRISELASSRLENGVITATEYLTERNAEEQAVLQEKSRRLQWVFAQLRLKQIMGSL